MNTLEAKVNAIAAVLLSTNHTDYEKAKTDLRKAMENTDETKKKSTREIIEDIFVEIGVSEHLKGYEYLVDAVLLSIEDGKYIDNICYLLYSEIAAKNSTAANRVERSIRHCIETAFREMDISTAEKYFGGILK